MKRIIFCACLLLAPGIYGQTAQRSGLVSDATRAAIRGATVDLRNEATGVHRTATTNGAGVYTLASVKTGTYQATVVNRQLLDHVPFQLAGTNRDVTSFVRMVPGVGSGAGNFSINITGGRQHASEILVDGIPNTYRRAVNTPFSVRPRMTSVNEFRVEAAVPGSATFSRPRRFPTRCRALSEQAFRWCLTAAMACPGSARTSTGPSARRQCILKTR